MENKQREVENLVARSKKLREISIVKQNLEETLGELTICNNVAILSKRGKMFSKKVLKVSCKVVGSSLSQTERYQTLLITVENVSDKLIFNCKYWQFCISINNGNSQAQSSWNLDVSLGPGQNDTFSCPLNRTIPFVKVSVCLKFIIQFESKTYARSFDVQECIVDALHCLDPGRTLSETEESVVLPVSSHESCFVGLFANDKSTKSFPSITKFMLKLDACLKEKFICDILLRDSLHRGFCNFDELTKQAELSVYYLGNKIDIKLSPNSDIVAVKCENPTVLCAVKASIMRRLVTINGILVNELDDENLEKVHRIRLKLSSFESDCSADSVDVDELLEFYLELRDVSESIRFSVVHVID